MNQVESIKEFVGLRAKTYSQLIDNGDKDKNAKDGKKCAIKRKLHYYKSCLEATQLENKMNQLKKIKFLLKKLKRLHYIVTMIKEYNQLIQQKRMHMKRGKI